MVPGGGASERPRRMLAGDPHTRKRSFMWRQAAGGGGGERNGPEVDPRSKRSQECCHFLNKKTLKLGDDQILTQRKAVRAHDGESSELLCDEWLVQREGDEYLSCVPLMSLLRYRISPRALRILTSIGLRNKTFVEPPQKTRHLGTMAGD